jgi:hypothetical protein
MRRKLTLSLLAIFLAISFSSFAQVPSLNPVNGVVPAVMNTAGGHDYNLPLKPLMFEWSLGELVLVQSFSPADSSFMITQGVLQPCTDDILHSPYTLFFENGDYKLYPNPTSGKVTLDFFVKMPGTMSLQLINSTGQIIESRSYYYNGCCNTEVFDLTRLPNGIYFVVADLKPLEKRSDGLEVIRHSGFRLVKMGNQ